MGKLRVHELAKKLDMKNAELIDKLKASGFDVKTHSSSVEEAEALQAIGAQKPVAEVQPERQRMRTIVRRRRPGEEDGEEDQSADGEEQVALAPEAPEPAPAAPREEEPAPLVVQPAPSVAAPAAEAPAQAAEAPLAAPTAEAVAREPMAAAAARVEQPVEASTASPQAEGAAPIAADGEKKDPVEKETATPQNVVRRIDPNAIKERLAAEGRTFTPPRPRRQFSQVREIRVLHDRAGGGPQLVDVTAGAAGAGAGAAGPAGARPGRRAAPPPGRGPAPATDMISARERREMRGGRDLWMHPGKKRKSGKKGRGPEITQAAQHKRVVEIADVITVAELSHQMAIKAGQVIAKLMGMGMMVTVNQTIDYETAAIVASEFGFECKNVAFQEEDLLTVQMTMEEEAAEDLQPRAPVVTVMGHVDHGKTSLLDKIRNTKVVSGEAGGITQHIGAYSVSTDKGDVTFLDTPGHQAFTSMRARGAQVTDIVILVVAADDGVMPQTIEAINHAKSANVPIVVAINKCDKPDARPERVMQELTEFGLVSEEWGGDTQMVKVSALKGEGITELLDGVLLLAEVRELTANPDKRAEGTVVEAQLDKGRGPVATVLVQAGTLRQGDFIVAGEHYGKVRAMYDSSGLKVLEAGPSAPVAVLGLSGVPSAGDNLNAVADDKTAKRVAEHRTQKNRERELQKDSRVSLENFLAKPADQEDKYELRLVIKADVDGSVEALRQSLEKLTTAKVKVSVVHSGVGTITESDINLAVASSAIVIGFNAKPDAKGHALAQHEKVDVRTYSVIYEALDEVKKAMAGMLAPNLVERVLGHAEVRALFSVPKLGTIAGSYVTDGKIHRSNKVRVKRAGAVLFEGSIASLRRFKDDVREVALGYECGIGVVGFAGLEEGDIIEAFDLEEVQAELDEALVNIKATPEKSTEAGATA
jgi:translation initiation factor IF-2